MGLEDGWIDGCLILTTLFLCESDGNGSSLQLYEKLSFSYSSLLQPLIHERDTHLALSLKCSKAVNKSKRVVEVIGRDHMNGKKAREGNSNGFVSNLLKSLVRDTIIGVILWVLYEQLK
uniref:Uncharacterized protein n=1 Tax=Cucumis melo TaxID=3656 RepID=A0A9I9ELV1_CUCME